MLFLRYSAVAALAASTLAAQGGKVFYFPKPVRPEPYKLPMRPLTRLADLKARHPGQSDWRELVIHDDNSRAWVVSEGPGAKSARRLYPDSPAWWAVLEGRIRFEIEGPVGTFQTIEARKGSYVYAPERMLHSLEVVGDRPAIRFEVTLARATPVFEEPQRNTGEVRYIPVGLSHASNPDDVPDPQGKPWPLHVQIDELIEQHKGQPSWSVPAMRKNRVRGNFICGLASAERPPRAGDRGHFHADFAEFWVVMKGQLRWTMEGIGEPLIASEGDIVYAPPNTFHVPQFYGKEGINCRLTSSTFPSANHIYDAR